MKIRTLVFLTLFLNHAAAFADQSIPDQYPASLLYSKPIELVPNVWTAIGATSPITYEDAGHNNNYTFIVGDDGVVVVNSGSYLLASAIVVTSIGYRFVLRRGALLNDTLHLPTRSDIDVQLVVGSLLFGVGWGIAGYCPGPAITGITGGLAEPFIFIVAMMVRWLLGTAS